MIRKLDVTKVSLYPERSFLPQSLSLILCRDKLVPKRPHQNKGTRAASTTLKGAGSHHAEAGLPRSCRKHSRGWGGKRPATPVTGQTVPRPAHRWSPGHGAKSHHVETRLSPVNVPQALPGQSGRLCMIHTEARATGVTQTILGKTRVGGLAT